MTYVHLKDVNVSIPVYDSHALRLITLPSFRNVRVGTDTASRSNGVIVIHALKNLSMDVEEGDRVCLIGHNGAGKTTLLRVVAGIYPSSTGSVDVIGTRFALLGGSISLSGDATGYENIKLIASLQLAEREVSGARARDRGFHRAGRLPVAPDPHLFGRHAGATLICARHRANSGHSAGR